MLPRALAVLCSLVVFFVLSTAAAQRPLPGKTPAPPAASAAGGTPVFPFESDDAEEQADAFTAALRAKLKATAGWTLSESTVSLAVLTAGLKCRLDAPCLQRVGDQLKADRFFWGRMTRAGKSQVAVEAHYWQRGKHDSVVKETFSDDLRDPASEGLKKIANRIFERLTGTLTTGMVTVRAGRGAGTVAVDGVTLANLVEGSAQLELKAGAHTIEIRSDGYLPVRQTVNVVVGAETPVTVALVAKAVEAPPKVDDRPSPVRRLVAYGLVGVGAVAIVVGAVKGVQWFGNSSDVADLRKNQYGQDPIRAEIKDPCAAAPAGVPPSVASNMRRACELGDKAQPDSTLAWIAGSVGVAFVGAGTILLLTEPSAKTTAAAPPRRWSLTPSVGPREGDLRFRVAF